MTDGLPTEHEEQVAVFAWRDAVVHLEPRLSMLFSIPNAGPGAQRGQAGKMKAEGMSTGVPDLFLACPSVGGRHGLFIEMKRRRGGTVSAAQAQWAVRLDHHGYQVDLAAGADEALAAIKRYLVREDLPS